MKIQSLLQLRGGGCFESPILNILNLNPDNKNFGLFENMLILENDNEKNQIYNVLVFIRHD